MKNENNKQGYTLAETLITLGIIGVIAAILIPLINKARPDEKKIMYLKAYDSLTEIVKFLAKNSAYYPSTIEFESGGFKYSADVSRFPLYNMYSTHEKQHQSVVGPSKLCKLIAEAMSGTNEKCEDTVSTASDSTVSWARPSFTTPNGMTWVIGLEDSLDYPPRQSGGNWEGHYWYNAYVKIKPDGNECMYSNNCEDPNVFKFSITADGKVHVQDVKGAEYVNSRRVFNKVSVKDEKTGEKTNVKNETFKLPVTKIGNVCGDNEYWNGNQCTQNVNNQPSPGENNEEKQKCLADGDHWYNGQCWDCIENEYWTGTKCAPITDSPGSPDTSPDTSPGGDNDDPDDSDKPDPCASCDSPTQNYWCESCFPEQIYNGGGGGGGSIRGSSCDDPSS